MDTRTLHFLVLFWRLVRKGTAEEPHRIPCPRLPQCKCIPPNIEIHCTGNESTLPTIRMRFQRFKFDNYSHLNRLRLNIRSQLNPTITFNGVEVVKKMAFYDLRPVHSVQFFVSKNLTMEPFALFGLQTKRFEIVSRAVNPQLDTKAFDGCSIDTLIIDYNRNVDQHENVFNGTTYTFSNKTQVKFLIAQELRSLQRFGNKSFPGFHNTQYVRVTHSSLKLIEAYAFTSYPSMNEIDLSNNEITVVSGFAFTGLPSLTKLTLTNNPVKQFSSLGVPTEDTVLFGGGGTLSYFTQSKISRKSYQIFSVKASEGGLSSVSNRSMLIMYELKKVSNYSNHVCTIASFPRDVLISLGYEASCTCPVYILHNRYGRGKFMNIAPVCYRNLTIDEIESTVPFCLDMLAECGSSSVKIDDYQYDLEYPSMEDLLIYEDDITESEEFFTTDHTRVTTIHLETSHEMPCSSEKTTTNEHTQRIEPTTGFFTETSPVSTRNVQDSKITETSCNRFDPIYTALTVTYIVLFVSIAINFILIMKLTRQYA
ncbi:hypothetical protein ACOME3_001313 [Neoechinorhynchus agilis]